MPMVTVDWFKGRTPEQKSELAHRITTAFVEVVGTPREQVWIRFNDVPRADWAMGGKLCSEG